MPASPCAFVMPALTADSVLDIAPIDEAANNAAGQATASIVCLDNARLLAVIILPPVH